MITDTPNPKATDARLFNQLDQGVSVADAVESVYGLPYDALAEMTGGLPWFTFPEPCMGCGERIVRERGDGVMCGTCQQAEVQSWGGPPPRLTLAEVEERDAQQAEAVREASAADPYEVQP